MFLLLIIISNSILDKIPSEYQDLVKQAKINAKRKKLSLNNYEQDVYTPGFYTIGNFSFYLKKVVTGTNAKGFRGFAINCTKKVVAIISQRQPNKTDIHTERNTVIPTQSKLIQLDEKIADDGEACILRYNEIDPFSIFDEFEFTNINNNDTPDISFSTIYSPSKSLYGNEIYKKYGLNSNFNSISNTTNYFNKFITHNWPVVTKGIDISQQSPIKKEIEFVDINNNIKTMETRIGGIFGLFAGINVKFNSQSDVKISIFQGCEAEINVDINFPGGEYNIDNIIFDNGPQNILNYSFSIFGIKYSVEVDGTSFVGINNISFKSNKNLGLKQRAGFKAQKEFNVLSSQRIIKTPYKYNYELLKSDILPPEKDFLSEKLDFKIDIYSGLTLSLKSSINRESSNFKIDCGIDFKRSISAVNNSDICPCPYLLSTNTDILYLKLDVLTPFVFNDFKIIPVKKFYPSDPLWIGKQSNPWCIGGNLHTYDLKQNIGDKNSAALIIESVKFAIENIDTPQTDFQITAYIYPIDMIKPPMILCIGPFKFSKFAVLDEPEINLNYIGLINNFTKTTSAKFECNDLSNNIAFTNLNVYQIGNGFDGDLIFSNQKGEKIIANILISSCSNCEFDVETIIESTINFASVRPNVAYGNSIGLIIHQQGSSYECFKTLISDEFSFESINDCVYPIKNIWNVKVAFINVKSDFQSISLTFKKKDENAAETILKKEIKFNEIKNTDDISFNIYISQPDDILQMDVDINLPKKQISQTNIIIDQNFFDLKRNKKIIYSEEKELWEIHLELTPINYPIIFQTKSIKTNISLIFAPAYKSITPFSNTIKNGSPSTQNIEFPYSIYLFKYGIFKLEFELDIESYISAGSPIINALLIMEHLVPICENIPFSENSYIFKIKHKQITTYLLNGKTIACFSIPFRRTFDIRDLEYIYPTIKVVDIYVGPSENEESCTLNMQIFEKAYPFIHNACIAKYDEKTKTSKYFSSCIDNDINVTQYIYPLDISLDINWNLLGFALDSENADQTKSHYVILRPSELEYPSELAIDELSNSYSKYFIYPNDKLTYFCPRCSAIKCVKINNTLENKIIYPRESKFSINIQNDAYYEFLAVCKDDNQKKCETILSNLNKNNLTLLSVPSSSEINDEIIYKNKIGDKEYIINGNHNMQFTLNRENITYTISTKSKLKILHTFETKLNILITAKAYGPYIKIYASANGVNIPFSKKLSSIDPDITNDLSILGNDFFIIGGNFFLYNTTTVKIISSIEISKSKKLFGIDESKVNSINVDYRNIGIKTSIPKNNYCFVQTKEDKCLKSNYLTLRYPEFNFFSTFSNGSKNINILILENITDFYPYVDTLRNVNVIFTCIYSIKISGEFSIPPDLVLIFNGPFNLKDLYITTYVDWIDEKAGKLSFNNVKSYPHIDVAIKNDPNEYMTTYDKSIKLILNGSTTLNLLSDSHFISLYEEFKYSIENNSIHCLFYSSIFEQQNDFCVYKNDRNLCSTFQNMNSISYLDLNNFQNYFQGIYENTITFHITEDIKLNEDSLQTFFENHPYTSLNFVANKKVYLRGIIKCAKDITISFDDQLIIDDLIIEKNVSIIDMYNINRTYGIINLNQKKVKNIKINTEDLPQTNIIDIDSEYLFIQNCTDELSYSIDNKTSKTKYLQFSIDLSIINSNAFINVTVEIIYIKPNSFCIYDDKICDIEIGRPIQSKDINLIENYIDSESNDSLNLFISQDINTDFDLCLIQKNNRINYVLIYSDNPKRKFSGKITSPAGFKSTIENLNIDGLEIEVKVNISQATSSFYNISKCNGSPKLNLFNHGLPMSKDEWGNSEGKTMNILVTCSDFIFNNETKKMAMKGGFIVQSIIINEINKCKTVLLHDTYQEIQVQPNKPNHYCIYETDKSKCVPDVNSLKINEFCSQNFIDSLIMNEENVFLIAENITFPEICDLNFNFYQEKISLLMYGNSSFKGQVIIKGNVDVVFLNSMIIEELQITLFAEMLQKLDLIDINLPSIITYENSKPKSFEVKISNYSEEIEKYEFSSRLFLKGVCISPNKSMPVPSTRDFRIKSICLNDDGILGMILKCHIQKYNPNQFCYYENDITKCISNPELEKYIPIKYSDVSPSFVANKTDISIYLYEKPSTPFMISFQIATLLGHKVAEIVNNDQAKTIIFIPYDFVLKTSGSFDYSEFYIQFDYDVNNNIKYGSIFCTSPNIYIHPVDSYHGSFIHNKNIELSEIEEDFSSILGQNELKKYQIKRNSEMIIINSIIDDFGYLIDGSDENSFLSIFYGWIEHFSTTAFLSMSDILYPYRVTYSRLAIKSTKDYTITFDMAQFRSNSPFVFEKHLFIDGVNIDFTKEEDCDFKDLYVTFRDCELDSKWKNKVKGNHLNFDHSSYYSFYDTIPKINAFDGDYIDVRQSYLFIQNEKFEYKNEPLIQLNSFNSFSDISGKTIEFTGTKSIFSISTVIPGSKLKFYNFTDLTVIAESINDIIYLYHVKKCSFQIGYESVPNIIKYIEIGEEETIELQSNGVLYVDILNISTDFDAKSIAQINEIEIDGNRNITIFNAIINDKISINNSYLSIQSSKSIKAVTAIIKSFDFEYPQLIFDSNNSIEIKSIFAINNDNNITESGYLIKGLNKSECESVKDKICIYDANYYNHTNDFEIKCVKDKNKLKYLVYFEYKTNIDPENKYLGLIIASSVVCGAIIIIIGYLIIACALPHCKKSYKKIDNRDETTLSLVED